MRLRAIACALWFGLLPWPAYESRCHYAGMTYAGHVWLNLHYAWVWITHRETEADRQFEREVNSRPVWTRRRRGSSPTVTL